MPRHSVLLATDNSKAVAAITAYFSDTDSIPSVIRSKGDCAVLFSSKPNFVFFQGDWVDSKMTARLIQFKKEYSKAKFFTLGEAASPGFAWDGSVEFPVDEKNFRKAVLAKTEFPKPVRLLIMSGKPQLVGSVRDYFEARQNPDFQVLDAANEAGTLKHFGSDSPHCLLIDLSTVSGAGDIFHRLEEKGFHIPTIVFTHPSGMDQILELRKRKAPIFMELDRLSDSMPDLLAAVKKLIIFS